MIIKYNNHLISKLTYSANNHAILTTCFSDIFFFRINTNFFILYLNNNKYNICLQGKNYEFTFTNRNLYHGTISIDIYRYQIFFKLMKQLKMLYLQIL